MKKKAFGIAVLAIILISTVVVAQQVCLVYSTSPTGSERRGLYANLSGRSITIESSIDEPVKIIEIKIGSNDYTYQVKGEKRISAQGGTTLTVNGTGKLSGTLLIRAESCD
ncbi:MAG: hypothetical protein LBG42_05380 [Treponema sp.]|jgi:hypothetical protein|nr:hypothetical protein [Treponema sp.]